MKVLDKGEIKLIQYMASDLSVVAAARVSNDIEFEEASKGEESDEKLINYLLKHRHGTPFEHTAFTFFVKAPLFVVREWQRHRIASYNEVSGRYVAFEPEFYIPDKIREPAPTNKQGSVFGPLQDDESLIDYIAEISEKAYIGYKELLMNNVAKEMARMVLPLNLYTKFYFTVNARALMNFISLRSAPNAQWEIQRYSNIAADIFKEKMPLTYKAFEANNFIAP